MAHADSTMVVAARYDRRRPLPPAVSIIVPTFNESENIGPLIDRLETVMADFDYEVIVVDDDSPDQTWRIVDERAVTNGRVRSLRRIGHRGLSSAVLDGMAMSEARVLAVMDADLQHDEAALPDIVSAILDDEVDICLGSRGAEGGSYGEWGASRRFISWGGAQLARQFLGVTVQDPMSGYFAVSRERFEAVRGLVNPRGFKILLELMSRGPTPRVAEVGYHFRRRSMGETKLSGSVVTDYLFAIIDLWLGRWVTGRVIPYFALASIALVLRILIAAQATGLPDTAQFAAFEASIVVEFYLHNRITFGANRHPRSGQLVPLVVFHMIVFQATLTQLGLVRILETLRSEIGGAAGFWTASMLGTAALIVTIGASRVLNGTLTWPRSMERSTVIDDTTTGRQS